MEIDEAVYIPAGYSQVKPMDGKVPPHTHPRSRLFFALVGAMAGAGATGLFLGLTSTPSVEKLAESYFRVFDRDEDDGVTQDEYVMGRYQVPFLTLGMEREIRAFVTGKPYLDIMNDEMRRYPGTQFRRYDLNGDGTVTREEYVGKLGTLRGCR